VRARRSVLVASRQRPSWKTVFDLISAQSGPSAVKIGATEFASGREQLRSEPMPTVTMYAQGDILIERLRRKRVKNWSDKVPNDPDGVLVLERGELSGHRHAVHGEAALYREYPLGYQSDHYIGHLSVTGEGVELRHEEHDPIPLPKGIYRIRRQAEYTAERLGSRFVAD
jgi:hypothetical protein